MNTRMTHVITSVIMMAALLLVLLVGCARPAPPQPVPTQSPTATPTPTPPAAELPIINIKMNGLHSEGTIWTEWGVTKVAQWIEQLVPRAKVSTHPGNVLVPYADAYMGVQQGIADFSLFFSSSTPGAFPLHEVVDLPALFPGVAISRTVLNHLYRSYPQFLDEFHPDIVHMGSSPLMRLNFHSRTPIRTLDDLKGKVVGCYMQTAADALKLLGAQPTLMPASDYYTPLERGIMDAAMVPWGIVQVWRIHEVAPYHTEANLQPCGTMFAGFNRDTWNKFTPDEQALLKFALPPQVEAAMNVAATSSLISVLEKDVYPDPKQEVIQLSPEELDKLAKLLVPLQDQWVKKVEALGHPGTEILETSKLLVQAYTYG